MDSIMEEIAKSWERGDYGKITEIIISVFVFIAPSYSFVFLYKRELFKNLEFINLMIICLISNVILISIIYTYEFTLNWHKFVCDENKSERSIKKYNKSIIKQSFVKVMLIVVLMWTLMLNDIVSNVDKSYEDRMIRLMAWVVSLTIVCIICEGRRNIIALWNSNEYTKFNILHIVVREIGFVILLIWALLRILAQV